MPQRDHTMTPREAWAVSPASRVWVVGNNTDARREIELLVVDAQRPATGEIDRAFIAPLTIDEAVYFARKIRPRLAADGFAWIVHPKAGSPREGEFSGNIESLAVGLFELGYAESGRTNLTGDYTSLGFHLDRSQEMISF